MKAIIIMLINPGNVRVLAVYILSFIRTWRNFLHFFFQSLLKLTTPEKEYQPITRWQLKIHRSWFCNYDDDDQ